MSNASDTTRRIPWYHWFILIPYYLICTAWILWCLCFGLTFFISLGGYINNEVGGEAEFDNLGPVATFLRWVVLNPLGWVTNSAQLVVGIAGLILLGLMALYLVGDKRLKKWRRRRESAARWKAEEPMRKAEAERRWGICPECGDRVFDNDLGRCVRFHPPKRPAEQERRPLAGSVRFPMASTGKRWTRCPHCSLQYVGEKGSCPACDRSSVSSQ